MQTQDRPFTSAGDISVVLTYYLQAHLRQCRNSVISSSGSTWAEFQRVALDCLMTSRDRLIQEIPVSPEIDLSAMLSHRAYLTRLAEIAVERLRASPDAPSLRITPGALTPAQVQRTFGQGLLVGLIYGAETIYMQDTVLAFQADVTRLHTSTSSSIYILGVHRDGLTSDMKVKRALVTDESHQISEMEFEEPLSLHMIQTLHLPRKGEQLIHQEISAECERLDLPQINPYKASKRADDKFWTHLLWSSPAPLLPCSPIEVHRGIEVESLPTPLYHRIDHGTSEETVIADLRAFLYRLQQHCSVGHDCALDLVVQPNRGTEGQEVAHFNIKPNGIEQLTGRHPAIRYIIDKLLSKDDILLREERGTLRYRHPKEVDRGYRRITFRIHVAWNGSAFIAESGYAQVAPDQETFVASRSCGGTIVGLRTAFSHLCIFDSKGDSGRPILLAPDDIARIRYVATQAARALNRGLEPENYLKFVGIDMVLEQSRTDHVLPVLLEANPRPAGLQHAEEIPLNLDQNTEPKITSALFTYIRNRV